MTRLHSTKAQQGNAAVLEEQRFVAATRHQLRIVSDHEASYAQVREFPEIPRGVEHVHPIKAARGLVEHAHAPPARHRARYRDALLLTAGQRHGMRFLKTGEVEPRQHSANRLLAGIAPAATQGQRHLLRHAFCEELVVDVLHDHVAQLLSLRGAHDGSVYRYVVIATFLESAEAAGECRLSRAVVPDHPDDSARAKRGTFHVDALGP